MTWADFYLICFVVGFAFSFLSFVAGALHWHFPHVPHGMGHGGQVGHVAPGTQAGPGASAARGATPVGRPAQVSPFNFMTLSAFLAWFGGTGYLLTRYSAIEFVLAILFALVSGLLGAAIVFLFMTRVLTSEEESMDPADYDMVGVLGRVSSLIRENGTGEIIYSQAGTRRTCGARSEDGAAISKGEEVVVSRYEKGIAYVRRWSEITADEEMMRGGTDQA
jgi:membrane protein implicated in regulation of membrane protease activity